MYAIGFNKVEKVWGVKRVSETKYLGVQVNMDRQKIKKNINACMYSRHGRCQEDSKTPIHIVYIRSICLYHLTPLASSGLINQQDSARLNLLSPGLSRRSKRHKIEHHPSSQLKPCIQHLRDNSNESQVAPWSKANEQERRIVRDKEP